MNGNSVDPDQLASSEASCSGSTLFSIKGLEVLKTYVLNTLIRFNTVYTVLQTVLV